MKESLAKSHFRIHTMVYDKVYNKFPNFDDLFDEESFYLFAAGLVIVTILVCFLLSRKITLHEAED